MLRNVSAPRGHVTRGAEAERLLGPYFFIVFEVSRQIFTHFILLASRSFNMVSSGGQSSAGRCEHNSNMSLTEVQCSAEQRLRVLQTRRGTTR